MISVELAAILIVAAFLAGAASVDCFRKRRDAEERDWVEFQNLLTRSLLENVNNILEEVRKRLDSRASGPAPSETELACLRQCRVMYMSVKEEEKKHV